MKDEYDFSTGRRGAIQPTRKVSISIRLDPDVLHFFRSRVIDRGEGSYQADINQALREAMEREQQGDRYRRDDLRRLLREAMDVGAEA